MDKLYRFEFEGQGIYEAVESQCPRTDPRRSVKPDGSWLPRVGESYPSCISFWTEEGLIKYINSGLQDWHRAVVPGEPFVREAKLGLTPKYEDQFQVIAEPEAFIETGSETANEFFLKRSSGKLIEKVGIFVVRTRKGSVELLVFKHRNYPELGIQFPAGTVENHESPATAATRELFEETGLQFLIKPHLIGTWTFYKTYSSQFQRRHVYLFREETSLPDFWSHEVKSGADDSGLIFEFEWQRKTEIEPTLIRIEGLGNSLTRI